MSDLSFYHRLVGVTIGPLVVLAALYATYRFAMYHHRSFGRVAAKRRQRAKVRHASAALLVLFLARWFCSVVKKVDGGVGKWEGYVVLSSYGKPPAFTTILKKMVS